MAWSFGDSFDLYAAVGDALGYWDGIPNNIFTFVAGRFSGSRAIQLINANVVMWFKNSGSNDAVHHIVVAYQTGNPITGATLNASLQLSDGATPQCSIVFRSDGAILLQSGAAGGTTLATYTGAFAAINTWYAFEFEVVINNTTGSFAVRRNGNNVNDFSATSLNTRGGTTNNYANRLSIAQGSGAATTQYLDDLFWQSGAATGTWLGDLRCYTRMPASDVQNQFSQSGPRLQSYGPSSFASASVNLGWYNPFTVIDSGAIGSVLITTGNTYAGHIKVALFNDNAGTPGTVLQAASSVLTPATAGTYTVTFSPPVPVTVGQKVWLAICTDTSTASMIPFSAGSGLSNATTVYSTFPLSNPTGLSSAGGCYQSSLQITVGNSGLVNEVQQDGLTTYVYDSNPGDADFYGIASIASTPLAVIATTTRAYMQKSDVGTRTAAVQLKSGATTVASPTLTLSSSGWLWAWRTDLTDPNTGSAWTATAVNNAQIGPTVVA